MVQLADRVKFSTNTTGQGTTIAVGSPESGYQSVPSSLDGETLRIVIEDGNAWEISTAVYGHSSSNLTSRTLTSSSTGSLLNLSGSAKVFISPIVDDLQLVQVYSSTSDLPSASSNHGRITHVHGDGAMYFAHGGNWIKLANASDAISLTDLSVTQNAASGSGALTYNSATGAFSYTPPASTSASGGTLEPVKETEFTATANQTTFTVTYAVGNIAVFLNGSKLGAADFTATNGTSVVLAAGATANDLVEVVEYGAPFAAPYSSNIYTANGSSPFNSGNTVLTADYTQGKEAVYVNGVKLLSGTDYTTNTGGTTITFTSALSTNDKVELVEHGALAASGVTTYANTAAMPTTGNSTGDLAFVAPSSLYSWSGSAWYMTTLQNQQPSWTSTISSSYNLATDGSATTITLAASDPEGMPITYGYSVSPSNQSQATLSLSGGTLTITPSQNTSDAGSFTLTATANVGGHTISQTSTINLNFSYDVDYLVIGGGGGGAGTQNSGYSCGGGGGAGGYRNSYNSETSGGGGSSETAITITTSTNFTVTVGAGGAGGAASGYSNGSAGSDSVFGSITSVGGGYGSANSTGGNGGSGGGGGYLSQSGGTGTANQGYAGGSSSGSNATQWPCPGGGGAGGAGGNVTSNASGGAGGAGLASSITGASVTRAVGGDGGDDDTSQTAGANGAANTGNGGAGGEGNAGGSGGSGIVIIRYPTSSGTLSVGSGLTYTTTNSGSDTIVSFTAGTGTITLS